MQVIRDNFGASQYDAYVDGAVAGSLHYRIEGDQMWLLHTAVGQDFRGTGLDDRLIRNALADAHRRRLSVLPFCHEVRKRIFAHPVYLQLVPAGDRDRFRESFEEVLKAEAEMEAKRNARKAATLVRVREAAAA
ncbi:hypothetical protein D477_018736 [Arthrobacter crystallopoietes BAB-32]|uniref:Uncharacterized protein n=1 Tax=Arthrobacter crystallopoietes BAB-32 TaxID=1246476 RepID=N1V381_9MICC|nr:GNAT family N-acetyltransferase [Arthrobacter crystallopoietes]EMY32698.1 hypothetical protein D477_018736 [Arthrobacter crystallopoietes BAB-32]